jgi:hypothetical protein
VPIPLQLHVSVTTLLLEDAFKFVGAAGTVGLTTVIVRLSLADNPPESFTVA